MTAATIRPLRESELGVADRIFRLAFGTFLGLPDPLAFGRQADIIGSRWRADPASVLAAELGGELVGSNCLIHWGKVGLFGPLTVRPDLWDRGVAKRLLEATMERFESGRSEHLGLFTFPNSPKHLGLYQKFGYWPRSLIAVMTKPLARHLPPTRWSRLSTLAPDEHAGAVRACRAVTDSVYDGLDVEREITAVASQAIGDTVLVQDGAALAGFGVCHYGPGSEAETNDVCFVKFGAVRGGGGSGERFERLLDSCEALAIDQGHAQLVACVNTGRHEAYRRMLARGFRVDFTGIAMHRHHAPGYD
ncbi:MAG: GNAT family N-acetyltransferase, partial [Candidatus Rokuibacteriota bacterium]